MPKWDDVKFLQELIARQTETIDSLQEQINIARETRREFEKDLVELLEENKGDVDNEGRD